LTGRTKAPKIGVGIREESMSRVLGVALATLAALAAAAAGGTSARAAYPEKPVRIVVNFPGGGPSDIAARVLAQKFSEAWATPVVIENIAGASGNIGADRVAKAAPDGHTLLVTGNAALVINPGLYDKMPYDPLRDFAPVSQLCTLPHLVIVNNAVPAKTIQQLVSLARAQAGKLTFSSAGTGSTSHLAGEMFKAAASIDIRHVPYKGTAPTIPDLLGGRVAMTFAPMAVMLPLAREGKLRALAVTSAKRSSAAPELPTVAESGFPGFEATTWIGLLAPANTPASTLTRLHTQTAKALALPDVRAKFADLGMEPVGGSPEELALVIRSDLPRWARVIKNSGARPE
jgi:tripartite-type tricarboxylate transporter receptor subunit TctC